MCRIIPYYFKISQYNKSLAAMKNNFYQHRTIIYDYILKLNNYPKLLNISCKTFENMTQLFLTAKEYSFQHVRYTIHDCHIQVTTSLETHSNYSTSFCHKMANRSVLYVYFCNCTHTHTHIFVFLFHCTS